MTLDSQNSVKPPISTTAERIGVIKNPLTIIAIFAGIAELSGTIVLPFLKPEIQSTFVWFVMSFPTILVILFFAVLNSKHHVLYAPSDYRDDETFKSTISISRASKEEIAEKLQSEQSTESSPAVVTQNNNTLPPTTSDSSLQAADSVLRMSRYRIMEKKVLELISEESGHKIDRDGKVNFGNGVEYIFDGSYIENGVLHAFELIPYRGLQTFRQIETIVNRAIAYTQGDSSNFKLNIILYTDSIESPAPNLERIRKRISYAKIPVNLRYIPNIDWRTESVSEAET